MVLALEDLEAIKRLKARYAQVCDIDHYNPEEMVKLFTEDAEWIGQIDYGKGREGIRKLFSGVSKRIVSAVHYFILPDIQIEGNKARGLWYMWVPLKMADGKCIIMSGTEADKYEKVNSEWLIGETRVRRFFTAVDEKAWQ